MNAETFNRHIADGRQAAEEHLEQLNRGYRLALQTAGTHAADAFARLAVRHLTADASNPGWTPPEDSQLIDAEALQADAKKRTRTARHAALKAVASPALADIGIAYDLTNPLAAQLVDTLGVRARDLTDAVRDQIAQAVLNGYQQGLSVVDTAKAIKAAAWDIAPSRAAMLARTDLNSIANGASVMAARIVNGAAEPGEPQVGFKRWIATEDERTRETHAQADGQIVPLDQPFLVGGEEADYPCDPDLSDEESANCRCAIGFADEMALAATAVQHGDLGERSFVGRDHGTISLVRAGGHMEDDISVGPLGDQVGMEKSASFAREGSSGLVAVDRVPVVREVGNRLRGVLIADSESKKAPTDLNESKIGIDQQELGAVRPAESRSSAADRDRPFAVNESRQVGELLVPSHASDRGGINGHLTDGVASEGRMSKSPDATATVDEAVTADVTVTVGDDSAAEAAPMVPTRWRAILCTEGQETQDSAALIRVLAEGETTWRDLPLPLGVMYETPHSDDFNAELCGQIDMIYRDQSDFRVIWGEGSFNLDAQGARAAARVADLSLRGISIDPYVPRVEIFDQDATEENGVPQTRVVMHDAVICAATICPVQALDGAQIAVIASVEHEDDHLPYGVETCFVLSAATVAAAEPVEEIDPRVAESLARLEQVTRPERMREYQLGMEIGFYSLNDCLKAEGRPTVQGGDERGLPLPATTQARILAQLAALSQTNEAVTVALERVAAHEEQTQALVASIDTLTERLAAGERVDGAMIETLRSLAAKPRGGLRVIRDDDGRAIGFQPDDPIDD